MEQEGSNPTDSNTLSFSPGNTPERAAPAVVNGLGTPMELGTPADTRTSSTSQAQSSDGRRSRSDRGTPKGEPRAAAGSAYGSQGGGAAARSDGGSGGGRVGWSRQ